MSVYTDAIDKLMPQHEAGIRVAKRRSIFSEIDTERERQHAKFGIQNRPIVPKNNDGNASRRAFYAAHYLDLPTATVARNMVEGDDARGRLTYASILVEELCEMIEACAVFGDDSDEAREKAVQVAAVAVAIIERIDRARNNEG